MPLSGSRLNTERYDSILAGLQAQVPLPAGLQAAEQTAFNTYQQKLAHAIADLEGTDIVSEITVNASVPSVTSTPGAQAGVTTLPGTATGTVT